MITIQKLNELMKQNASWVSYSEKVAKRFLKEKWLKGLINENNAVDLFVDYIMSQNLADEVVL